MRRRGGAFLKWSCNTGSKKSSGCRRGNNHDESLAACTRSASARNAKGPAASTRSVSARNGKEVARSGGANYSRAGAIPLHLNAAVPFNTSTDGF